MNPDLDALKKEAFNLRSWTLTDRQLCDIELLLNGGFYPLYGFMRKVDYDSVLESMRLEDESLWPIPITLDVTEDFAEKVVEVEQKITDKKIRDRVLVNPGLICSKCENCLKDMTELCSNPGSN